MTGDDLHRPEIKAFILDCETLLSPVLLQPPMTPDECKVVEMYAHKLGEYCQGITGLKKT
jgi:hypothetical protein